MTAIEAIADRLGFVAKGKVEALVSAYQTLLQLAVDDGWSDGSDQTAQVVYDVLQREGEPVAAEVARGIAHSGLQLQRPHRTQPIHPAPLERAAADVAHALRQLGVGDILLASDQTVGSMAPPALVARPTDRDARRSTMERNARFFLLQARGMTREEAQEAIDADHTPEGLASRAGTRGRRRSVT